MSVCRTLIILDSIQISANLIYPVETLGTWRYNGKGTPVVALYLIAISNLEDSNPNNFELLMSDQFW